MIGLYGAGVRFGGRWPFRGLDLEIRRGTSLAIIGPNGRGKTTLIRALIGAQRLTEGTRRAPPLVGYVPQVGLLAPYTVLDMVVMGRARMLGVFGAPSRDDYCTARTALTMVGISALATRLFNVISGGERQLVVLARALATGAETIVLDEPASALDLANQHKLLAILNDLRRRGDYTIIFSTHLPQHALIASDETLLLLPQQERLRGLTSVVLSEDNLERTYQVPVRRIPVAGYADALVPLLGKPVTFERLHHPGSNRHG